MIIIYKPIYSLDMDYKVNLKFNLVDLYVYFTVKT